MLDFRKEKGAVRTHPARADLRGRWRRLAEARGTARKSDQRSGANVTLPAWRVTVLFLVLGLALWGVWGCYTTLRHPVLRGSLSGESPTTTVSLGDDCWQCHSSRQEVFWPDESGVPTGGYYDWDFFYGVPWWVDSFYYSQRPAAAADERLPEPRRFRTRGEPAVTGAPAVSLPPPRTSIVARKRSEPGDFGSAPLAPRDPRRTMGRRGSGTNEAANQKERRRETRSSREE